MRLTEVEREKIKNIIETVFGASEIYLFGSRVDDTKEGGDIDLFVVPKRDQDLLRKKYLALHRLKSSLFKPVDLVVHEDFSRRIEQEAMKNGIKL